MKKKLKQITDSRYFSIGILLVYAALTLAGVILHENRLDETQAWCLVRDNDIAGIFAALRYEGHPPLWYMVLYPFVKAGAPPEILPYISWSFTTLTAVLIMWKAPFHKLLKILMLFSGGFIYFISIASRTYCILILILCLLAMLYPERKKHPLLFGLLVGLLAVTHIIMCGLVGMVGIFMLADAFSDWKKNPPKKNLLNITGILIALAGVVLLVVPVWRSVYSNNNVTAEQFTLQVFGERAVECLFCVGSNLVKLTQLSMTSRLFGVMVTVMFVVMLVMLRRWPRAVVCFAGFSLFFFLTTQIIFPLVNHVRANVFIYTFVFVYWAAYNSGAQKKMDLHINMNEISSPLLKKICQMAISADNHFYRSIETILCIMCMLSVPAGWAVLFTDYTCAMSAAGAVTDYIRENISLEDSAIISNNLCSPYCAAMPELKLYEPYYKRFITYDPLSISKEDAQKNYRSSHDALKQYQHIYKLVEKRVFYTDLPADNQNNNRNVLFRTRYYDDYLDYYLLVELYEVSSTDLEKGII